MELTSIAKKNLNKDKRVLGKAWVKTYGGFFGNKKHMQEFASSVIPFIPKKETLKILYVASASGGLGEVLCEELRKKGIEAELTLTDMSEKHLNENKNKNTKKICGDLLKLKLKEKYDVIIMRSSLDYFHTKKLQIRALKQISKWLSKEGILINQACSIENKLDRDTADKIYSSTNKIGKRHFQCETDIGEIYKKANLSLKLINKGPILVLTEKDHVKRYNITKEEIKKIQKIISKAQTLKVRAQKGQTRIEDSKKVKITKTGYELEFIFPIYLSLKI